MRFKNKTCVVTGAGRGIGRSVAMLLASEGASVVVNDLGNKVDGADKSNMPADDVVQEIRDSGGIAIPSYNSVAEFGSANEIIQTAIDNFGKIDVICHAAGILRDRMIFNMTEEDWDKVLSVHLYGAFNIVRNSIPHMIDQNYGRIVLFASSSGLGSVGQSNYSAAKEGIVGFVKSLSQELNEYNIKLNAVYPGADTRMMETVPEETRQQIRKEAEKSPSLLQGATELFASPEPPPALAPENNAPKVVYLCDSSSSITGQVFGTSGWTMSLYSNRQTTKSISQKQPWSLNELEQLLPISLASGLVNPQPPKPLK